jgi:hypothetical protein
MRNCGHKLRHREDGVHCSSELKAQLAHRTPGVEEILKYPTVPSSPPSKRWCRFSARGSTAASYRSTESGASSNIHAFTGSIFAVVLNRFAEEENVRTIRSLMANGAPG